MNRSVVILLSDKRSGSTLFEREMCQHTDVQHLNYTPHTYNESHYWVKAAYILNAAAEGFSGGVLPVSYGSHANARSSLIKTIQNNVSGFRAPHDNEQLVFDGWEALCRQFANPVFFEKSPHHTHHQAALKLMLKWSKQTDYQVRFIGLVRNPMAVMYSALQLFYTDPVNRQYGWVLANRNILEMGSQLGGDQFKFVKYEDLIKNPSREFGNICRFIDIGYQEKIGKLVNADSLLRWREDPEYHFQLDGTVAAYARDLGYTDAELFNPPKPRAGPLQRLRRAFVIEFKRLQSKVYNRIKRLTD